MLLLAGCAGRTIGPGSDGAVSDLSAPRDLSVGDLATEPDLSGVDLGPKLHLGESCTFDVQCISGHCLTPDETSGNFDHVCGAQCGVPGDEHPMPSCVEGVCMTFDGMKYWCLLPCQPTNMNDECTQGFVCCSGGAINACVSPFATECEPLS